MTTSLADPPIVHERITDGDIRTLTSGTPEVGQGAMFSRMPAQTCELKYIMVPGGELLILVERDPPVWFEPTVEALAELLWLSPDWDSYGAWAVDPSHVDAALRVLMVVMRDNTPAPSVGPTNRGGVQLEWHERGIDLEIETLSTQRLLVSF